MKLSTGKVTLFTAIPVLAAVVAMGVNLDVWPVIGWETPRHHDADYAEVLSDVKDFRDEWKCDEWDEELREKLREQAAGDNSTDLAEDIRRLREKMTELKCSRFDD